jgi:hypothetical protein
MRVEVGDGDVVVEVKLLLLGTDVEVVEANVVEGDDDPTLQSPYPRIHPTPQCSFVLPHQPLGEQQSPSSDPIQVWKPP